MLLRFRVTNYASLRDEQELSLIALDRRADIAALPIPGAPQSALPVVAIYGANAAGKSNALRALDFMRAAVCDSHQDWRPEAPIRRPAFRYDPRCLLRPTECVAEIVLDGVRYEYGFAVDDACVRAEWLYSFPERRRRVLFERAGPKSFDFGDSLKGRKQAIAEMTRDNSLFLSAAAANRHPLLGTIYRWFRDRLRVLTGGAPLPDLGATVEEWEAGDRAAVEELLRHSGTGVTGLRVRRSPVPIDTVPGEARGSGNGGPYEPAGWPAGGRGGAADIQLVHDLGVPGGAPVPVPLASTGTLGWVALAGPMISALRRGGLLVVDELTAALHPLLLGELVGAFQHPATNGRGAQLLFTTHDVTLLGALPAIRLHRDQVWFAERGPDGTTRLYPLMEYRVRDGLDSVIRGYLRGRYAGIPVFGGPPTHVGAVPSGAGREQLAPPRGSSAAAG